MARSGLASTLSFTVDMTRKVERLTVWTEVAGALPDHEERERPTTAETWLSPPATAVYRKSMLVFAGTPGSVSIGRKCGAAVLDCRAQNLADRAVEQPDLLFGEGACLAIRVDPGEIQCLVCIDVADSGDHSLVKQQTLDRGSAAAQGVLQVTRRECARERFRSKPGF